MAVYLARDEPLEARVAELEDKLQKVDNVMFAKLDAFDAANDLIQNGFVKQRMDDKLDAKLVEQGVVDQLKAQLEREDEEYYLERENIKADIQKTMHEIRDMVKGVENNPGASWGQAKANARSNRRSVANKLPHREEDLDTRARAHRDKALSGLNIYHTELQGSDIMPALEKSPVRALESVSAVSPPLSSNRQRRDSDSSAGSTAITTPRTSMKSFSRRRRTLTKTCAGFRLDSRMLF